MSENFKNRREIEAWLETQPRDVMSAFNKRAALRLFSGFEGLLQVNDLDSVLDHILLQSLYVMAVSVSVSRWPDKNAVLKSAFSNAASRASAIRKRIDESAYAESLDTDYAAARAEVDDAVYTRSAVIDGVKNYDLNSYSIRGVFVTHSNIARAITSAVGVMGHDAYFYALLASNSKLFNSYSVDRDVIISGGTAERLIEYPLWPKGNVPEGFISQWQTLKSYLLSLNQDWDVWTDWYEDRLAGKPLIEAIEIGDPENGQYGRTTFPPEDYENPAEVNAKIKKVIEDYWAGQATLEQDKTVETFGINAHGKITRTTSDAGEGLTDTPQQRDWYKSLRDAALGLQEIGQNALGRAARPAKNLIEALPEDLADAKVALLWPAANRVRRLNSAHEKAVASQEEGHFNLLAPDIVDEIDQLVGVYNNLVLGDENLAAADRNALGPQDVDEVIESNVLAESVIQSAMDESLFTPDAQAVLEDTLEDDANIAKEIAATGEKLSVLEQLALDNNARIKANSIRALIVRLRDSHVYGKIKDGALMAIGAGLVKYVAKSMPTFESFVRALFL